MSSREPAERDRNHYRKLCYRWNPVSAPNHGEEPLLPEPFIREQPSYQNLLSGGTTFTAAFKEGTHIVSLHGEDFSVMRNLYVEVLSIETSLSRDVHYENTYKSKIITTKKFLNTPPPLLKLLPDIYLTSTLPQFLFVRFPKYPRTPLLKPTKIKPSRPRSLTETR